MTYDPQNDYYQRMGVPVWATQAAVRQAYRRLALVYHPDRGGDPEIMVELNSMLEVLVDDDKRRVYDRARAEWVASRAPGAEREPSSEGEANPEEEGGAWDERWDRESLEEFVEEYGERLETTWAPMFEDRPVLSVVGALADGLFAMCVAYELHRAR